MQLAALLVALQLRATAPAAPLYPANVSDSIGDLHRARAAQRAFERGRRGLLPYESAGAGRCDVRLGRYCWWYDESMPTFPAEPAGIKQRRAELLSELDTLSLRYPGDDWLVGMRVHYRVDGRDSVGADSVARRCRASDWWCSALVGYATHARGLALESDSAFAASLASMPPGAACAWRNIAPLLDDEARRVYERASCDDRRALERRYWLLSRPQLAAPANEWRNEFNVRRVLVWLGERGATPHLTSWGADAAELVLRYGWPVAWGRVGTPGLSGAEPSIVGHDPSPSFAFSPVRLLPDSARPLAGGDWDLTDRGARARYAPPLVRRVANIAAQLARFRRGDSTLVVAAYAADDDSLHAPRGTLSAATEDGLVTTSAAVAISRGTLQLMMAGTPALAGVEVSDAITRTLARMRTVFAGLASDERFALSDLLVHQGGAEPAGSLAAALPRAVAGDMVIRDLPVGLFWETYGLAPDGETVDLSVRVERVDAGFLRKARQRLGLSPADIPIRIQWTDARPPEDRAAPHAVSLNLRNMDAGRYRITLTVTPANGPAVATAREIALTVP